MSEEIDSVEINFPEIQPKKAKKPYKVSQRVLDRNKKGNQNFLRNKAENERKLRDYEEIMVTKKIITNEMETLLNDKIVSKIEQSLTNLTFKQNLVPLEIIKEDEDYSSSDDISDSSEKRRNARFNKCNLASPKTIGRFRRV